MSNSAPQRVIIHSIEEPVYRASAVVAGIKLDLFTQLKNGPQNASQIAAAIRVDVTTLQPLLYALVVVGLLNVEGDLFTNSAEADYYLVRGRPEYVGENRADFWSDLFNATLKTAETIRTGKAQAEHDYSKMPPEQLESFLRALHSGAVEEGRTFASQYDFTSCRTLIDVGGGTGGVAIAMAEAYPQLQVTVVELPAVTPITERVVAEAGATDRIQVKAVDVVREPLTGSFDSAILRAFIQVLPAKEARQALINIGQAMTPGGRIIITGMILDDSRLSPPFEVLFNLVMLNLYQGVQIYTEQEYRDWLMEAGFEDIERVSEVIVARKATS